MGKITDISWCDATYNIARGCSKVDADCLYCYMYRDSLDSTRYNPFEIIKTKTVFDMPLKYKETESKVWNGKPLIFTSSLTDFFHPAIDAYRNEAWEIIRKCPHLIFQILTKRPERILENIPEYWDEVKSHVWLGTSIGSQKGIQRLTDLISECLSPVEPAIRFLSLEPLHAPVKLYYLDFIDWVIIGGESGNENGKYRYRPCQLEWIENIVGQCKNANIPVFIKQLGTHLAKEMKLKDRHGRNINEFPEHLRLREFPKQDF